LLLVTGELINRTVTAALSFTLRLDIRQRLPGHKGREAS
jgi:hypothetical protein